MCPGVLRVEDCLRKQKMILTKGPWNRGDLWRAESLALPWV